MADQLLKVREKVQEKLKKEAEVVVEIEQPSALQSATVNYLSRKEEPHPLSSPKNLNEMKKVEIKLNRGNVDKDIQKIVKHIGLVNKKRRANQQIKITQNMSDDSVTLDGGKNVDIDREVADIRNFIGYKSAKVVESVEEETLDEAKFKVGDTVIPSVGPHKGRKHEVIADLKNNTYNIKPIGLLAKQIQYRLGAAKAKANQIKLVKEETLDEIAPALMAIGRAAGAAAAGAAIGSRTKEQKINASKMSQLHMYIKQGKTAKEIGKLMGVEPKTIQKLMSAYDAKKIKEEMKIEAAIDEAKLIEKEKSVRQLIDPNKESMVMKKNKVIVIDKKDEDKYLKKGWALAEQDELQIKEWFKSKNIDVKVRELEESTQVYVPIGRRIPNEIREELIITQYGKMPEDVKNVEDINYGNFVENSITMNNDFWSKVLHGTKGE